jgi:hypothetical protein
MRRYRMCRPEHCEGLPSLSQGSNSSSPTPSENNIFYAFSLYKTQLEDNELWIFERSYRET